MTNIISLRLMKKAGFIIIYDSNKANIFYVIKPSRDQVLFENYGNDLYCHDTTKRAINFY